MPYTLNLYRAGHQLYLNKTQVKNNTSYKDVSWDTMYKLHIFIYIKYKFLNRNLGVKLLPRSSIRLYSPHSFMSPMTDTRNPQGYKYPILRTRVSIAESPFSLLSCSLPLPSSEMSSPFHLPLLSPKHSFRKENSPVLEDLLFLNS